MSIRPGVVSDAGPIAALVRQAEAELIHDPGAAGPFWASMSEQAHAQYLSSDRFRYLVGEADGRVLGFIAMRDVFHLFNLFVHRQHQRRGIARALWNAALLGIPRGNRDWIITVNASLNAVPAYRSLGFRIDGAVVRIHGIAFVPMRWSGPSTEA